MCQILGLRPHKGTIQQTQNTMMTFLSKSNSNSSLILTLIRAILGIFGSQNFDQMSLKVAWKTNISSKNILEVDLV